MNKYYQFITISVVFMLIFTGCSTASNEQADQQTAYPEHPVFTATSGSEFNSPYPYPNPDIPVEKEPSVTNSDTSLGLKLTITAKPRPTPTYVEPDIYQFRYFSFDPGLSQIAIISLDYQTLKIKNVYITREKACDREHSPVGDQELIKRAENFFLAVGYPIGLGLTHVGEFALLEKEPGDFGGFAISYPCSGVLLFAGSIIWAGEGEQFFPANPINPEYIEHTYVESLPPQQIDVVIGPCASVDEEEGLVAWESVLDLNIVPMFNYAPFSVFVYLYPHSVGEFNPDAAEWLVLLHRNPTR